MFNNLQEFENWLEISATFDNKKIKDTYTFIHTFPLSNFTDYIKAAKKIAGGVEVGTVIARYKQHLKSTGEHENDDFAEVVKMENVIEDMILAAETGLLKGSSTHMLLIDDCWKWRESEFTLFTGYNADGKSIFLRNLALVKGVVDKWKTAAFVPEDYPAVSFFDELIMTASGHSTDKTNVNYIGIPLYRKVYEQIKDYFHFVNLRPPKSTLINILNTFVPLIEREGVKICIIDPLVKITRPKEYLNSDALWAAYVSSLCTDFSRRFNVCLILVLHQLTAHKNEAGFYVKPDKYTIKNGGNFSDSTDNVLFLHRPFMPIDSTKTDVRFGSLKIKKHRLVAIPNEVMIKFNQPKNRYTTETDVELFDFDRALDIPRIRILF